ncbi:MULTISPECIES: hypothetical protein [Achromobacter]|uniref:YbjN domain-containing protein n=1 Tax=Achromobacter denitrificans TaxID=32002 RepID=A0A6N0JG05_ACHDE|nr:MULTISPECIES: hypothetical protein [Achromobacter]MDF3859869.1 hypothetical protein [Achromobacter denitrificans]QKQ45992.1 hypothetical protein FOC81_04495 [Achromobacter denitrificans]CAB3844754.1 hypothetical protein LMG1860_02510 [Achromobacter denitrificans]
MSRESAERMTRYFQSLLESEGFNRGQIDWDEQSNTSDLIFKVEGRNYILISDADDEDFARLVFPNFWPLDSDEEFAAALQAISLVNGRCKGVKVYASSKNDNIVATVEFLISASNPQLNAALFIRYIRMLNSGAEEFARIMREFANQQS